MAMITCNQCGFINPKFDDDYLCDVFQCINCGSSDITIYAKLQEEKQPTPKPVEVFEKGDVVKLTNKQHVWFDQIAIVKDKKPKFSRLELFNKLIWIPDAWITKHEPPDTY